MEEEQKVREKKRNIKKPPVFYRGPKAQYDYILLFAMLCLMLFGLLMLYSVTNYEDLMVSGDALKTAKKQALYMGLGLLVMWGVTIIDYHFCLRVSVILLVLTIVVCAYTQFFGTEVNGQRRWIMIGSFNFQSSELAKPALILILARYLTVHYKPRKRGQSDINIPYFLGGMFITGAATAFVIKNNLSTGLIVVGIGFFMLYTASKAKWVYPIIILSGAAALFAAWQLGIIQHVLNENRLGRIYAWLEPEKYPKGGYQILQSLYAVSSGGLFGKGLGTSIQKLGFLPEAQNDMIFAIICEELGWAGAIFTMLLFAVLFFRLHRVAQRAKDMSGFIIVSGVLIHLILQTVLNICVATNFMPNTGVTLPFISSGGTAIICTLGEIGLVLAVDRQSPKESDIKRKQANEKE